TLALGEPATDVRATPAGFAVVTPQRTLTARRVVLTTGGRSYPGSGTTGDGYRIAAAFGHTIVPPRPALAPVTTDAPWVRELRGVTLPDVQLSVQEDGAKLAARRGSLLFAHFGLTGPVALDVSRVVSGHPRPRALHLEIDLLPAMPEPAFDQFLQAEALAAGKKQLANVLAGHLPHRLAETLLALTGQPADR